MADALGLNDLSMNCIRTLSVSQIEKIIESTKKLKNLTRLNDEADIKVLHVHVTDKIPGKKSTHPEPRYFVEYRKENGSTARRQYTQSEIDMLIQRSS
ncbi:hypothetical protein KY310_03640 [Candidatus Woesearchaeota archaeon]|nr:hypothetical protein [Candidatus Woesearchaeota archaeon]